MDQISGERFENEPRKTEHAVVALMHNQKLYLTTGFLFLVALFGLSGVTSRLVDKLLFFSVLGSMVLWLLARSRATISKKNIMVLQVRLIAGIAAEATFLIGFWVLCDNAKMLDGVPGCFGTSGMGYSMLLYLATGMWIPLFLFPLSLVLGIPRMARMNKPLDMAHWVLIGLFYLLFLPLLYINLTLFAP